jgi:hypothetical protein
MRIQFVLTPTESKKLISKGVVAMASVKQALESGTVVIHPSSTTVFMLEELGITLDPAAMWICGLTVPRGLCASAEILLEVAEAKKFDPQKYSHQWIIRKGELVSKAKLGEILPELEKGDIYVKSPNALDPQGHAGILFTAQGAGTIGKVMKAQKKQNFEIILPTGLEKLVATPMKTICSESPKKAMNFCTGTPCGVVPISGTVVTEISAVETLSGAQAIQIAAGGVGGAEGATIMVVKGEKEQVAKAAEYLASVKGAALPELNILACEECPRTKCHLSPVFDAAYAPKDGLLIPSPYKK